MPSLRHVFRLTLFVTAAWAARATDLPTLPFMLDDPDGHWRLGPTPARALADGIELVAALAPRTGPARILIFKAPSRGQSGADALAAFADRLRVLTLIEPIDHVHSTAGVSRIGYTGHLITLDAPRPNGTSACEIFAFAAGADHWGLLQITPANTRGESPFASLKKARPVAGDAVGLQAFRVKDDPINSFPIGLHVRRLAQADRIEKIVVNAVPEGSPAERAGIRVGDEIVRIDGRAVTEFSGGISRRSDLGRLLLDRRPGASIELEFRSPEETETRSVTLTAGLAGPARPW